LPLHNVLPKLISTPLSLSKIRNQKLGDGFTFPGPSPARVSRFHSRDFKSFEYLADLPVIVDRENKFSLEVLQDLSHLSIILPREDSIAVIILAPIIRRIEIEECFVPVKALDHVLIMFVLNIDPSQAMMDRGDSSRNSPT
jgi:hypothetical protein